MFAEMEPGLQGSGKVYLQKLVQALRTSKPFNIENPRILVSSKNLQKDFFFPLDLSNYLINIHTKTEGSTKTITQTLFGRRDKIRADTRDGLTDALQFYQEIVCSLLQSAGGLPQAYPYTVDCVQQRVPLGFTLMLYFKPIPVPEQ